MLSLVHIFLINKYNAIYISKFNASFSFMGIIMKEVIRIFLFQLEVRDISLRGVKLLNSLSFVHFLKSTVRKFRQNSYCCEIVDIFAKDNDHRLSRDSNRIDLDKYGLNICLPPYQPGKCNRTVHKPFPYALYDLFPFLTHSDSSFHDCFFYL